MLLLKGSIIYLTGVLATSTTLNFLRTAPIYKSQFGWLKKHEVTQISMVWFFALPLLASRHVARLPEGYQAGKEEEKKKEKKDI